MLHRLSFLAFFLLTLLPLAGEKVTLLVPDYPPFSPRGERQGIWCEIVSRALEVHGIQVFWQIYPIERANMMVRSGGALGVVNSEIAFSQDYGKTVFKKTQPLFFADVAAFYDSRRFPKGLGVSSVETLRPYSVGGLRGTGSIQVLQDGKVNVQISDSRESLALKLKLARIDALILGDLTGMETVRDFIPDLEEVIKFESVYQSPINLIFSLQYPGASQVAEKYAAGLEAILGDGTYLEIVRSYYPPGKLNPMVLPTVLRRKL